MNKVRKSRSSGEEYAAYWSAILILEPILATGGSICTAIDLILRQGVSEHNIIISTLITSRKALEVVFSKYPSIYIITAAVDERLNAKW
jgi:uracil phosphoribosyltransferase